MLCLLLWLLFLVYVFLSTWSVGSSQNREVRRQDSPFDPNDCHVRAEESYFGLSWLPPPPADPPLLSLPVTQTPGSSSTRGLCLDLTGRLFLPAEETSLRRLTHRHTYSQCPQMCVQIFTVHTKNTCKRKAADYIHVFFACGSNKMCY